MQCIAWLQLMRLLANCTISREAADLFWSFAKGGGCVQKTVLSWAVAIEHAAEGRVDCGIAWKPADIIWHLLVEGFGRRRRADAPKALTT